MLGFNPVKMKSINIYLAVQLFFGVLVLMLTSCQKDFLDRTPSDFIDVNEVFSNIQNAEAFLNNAYNQLPDFQRPTEDLGGRYNTGCGTDELGYQQTASIPLSPYDFNNGNWNPVAFPMQRLWKDYYSTIRRINIFIHNHHLIPEEVSSSTSNRKERLLGEAYGLRAYYYFELFRMWGGVPIILSALDPSEKESVMLKRNSPEEVVQQIKSDISQSISLLPASHSDSQYGRFTATAGKALLSRITLYWASLLWNSEQENSRWTDAAKSAKEAIDYAELNGYNLSVSAIGERKSYERIFLELNNPEVIWSKNSTGETIFWGLYSSPLGYGGWYVYSPLQEMVDSYEMINGELPVLGYDSFGNQVVNPKAGYDPLNPYLNRDPRFYQSINYHGAIWQGRAIDVSEGGRDNVFTPGIPRLNYFVKKYISETHNLYTHEGNNYRRFALFRLGELYLNYAEALNEDVGPTNEVYNALNKIRSRVGMPDLVAGLTKEQMRDKIRHERKIELAFEDHRFWDVRRWKIAEIVDSGIVRQVKVSSSGQFSYPVFQNRVFDPSKHYLFPIPQTEIDKNPNIDQNLGW